MARAYAYASGDGPEPVELGALRFVGRLGGPTAWGRPMSVGEMQKLLAAEEIVAAFRSREKANTWATWAQEHPQSNAMLSRALKAYANPG